MKISISTYSFRKLFDGSMNQFDCIKKVKDMGFDAIEFAEMLPPEGEPLIKYTKRAAEECKNNGLPVSCFAFAADFLTCSDIDKEIDRVKKMVDIAEILGTKIIRHDTVRGYGFDRTIDRTFDMVLPVIAGACRQITEYAQTKGIKTSVENHGFFCQGSGRMEKLYGAVAHPNFGLLSDMGNFLCTDEDPAAAFGVVAPYTIHVHAKDFHVKSAMHPDPGRGFFSSRNGNYLRGTIIGHGNVPVKHCIDAMKNVGYDGYITIEFEGMEDTLSGIEIGLENLRRYIL